jgi:hypothetical protein
MTFSAQLIDLGKYLAGEFDNQQQALEHPAWFVHLRLWMRPINLFTEDSITFFAEQANVINLDRPYRPRIIRLRERENIEVEYYMFKDITEVAGAGENRDLLSTISVDRIEFLPNCTLRVKTETLTANRYRFQTTPIIDRPCSFNYQGTNFQVSLGFEVTQDTLHTYDKGIDPKTGQAIWGALMGAYSFTKRQNFATELAV